VIISHSGHFTPRKRTPDTHWLGGWVGPRAQGLEYPWLFVAFTNQDIQA